MKYLLAILPLICFAEEYPQAAGFPNNAGGWTVITTRDQYCGARGMNDGYAFGSDTYVKFCWIQRGKAVLAVLENGETRTWPIDSFDYLEAEPEFKNNKS